MSKKSNRFPPKARQRAVRLVQEHRGEYRSVWAAIESITPKIGCVSQTLHEWVRKLEIDTGLRDGVTRKERDRIKALEREVKELRRANEILKLASAFFPRRSSTGDSSLEDFVDKHRNTHRVKSICKALQIAPSGYRRHAAYQRKPELRCARAKTDDSLIPKIQLVWQSNMQVYGADKVWHQMNRESVQVARCTVERLMKGLRLQGVRRGKVVRTTVCDKALPCPLDRVNRLFKADRPNQL